MFTVASSLVGLAASQGALVVRTTTFGGEICGELVQRRLFANPPEKILVIEKRITYPVVMLKAFCFLY